MSQDISETRPFDLTTLLCEGETIADYTITGTETNWGAPSYQCIVPADANTARGIYMYTSLEETLHRILADRVSAGDADDVLRETMGVEREDSLDDDQGYSPIDLGYVLPGALTSFEPRPIQPESMTCPTVMDSTAGHTRGM